MLSKGVIFFHRCLQSSPVQREGDGALPRPVLAWRSRSRSRQREGPRRAQRHYFFLLKLSAFPSHAAQRDREASRHILYN